MKVSQWNCRIFTSYRFNPNNWTKTFIIIQMWTFCLQLAIWIYTGFSCKWIETRRKVSVNFFWKNNLLVELQNIMLVLRITWKWCCTTVSQSCLFPILSYQRFCPCFSFSTALSWNNYVPWRSTKLDLSSCFVTMHLTLCSTWWRCWIISIMRVGIDGLCLRHSSFRT